MQIREAHLLVPSLCLCLVLVNTWWAARPTLPDYWQVNNSNVVIDAPIVDKSVYNTTSTIAIENLEASFTPQQNVTATISSSVMHDAHTNTTSSSMTTEKLPVSLTAQQNKTISNTKRPLSNNSSLLEIEEPIMGPPFIPHQDKPVRVRVLLFDNDNRAIRFRRDETWAISDELLNICMDGWNQSVYFDLINATVVPDYHSNPDFVLKEQEDIVWVIDMRRIVWRSDYSIFRQVLHAVNDTLRYQKDELPSVPSLKVVFMDWHDMPEKTWCTRYPYNSQRRSIIQQLINILGIGNVRKVIQQKTTNRRWSPENNFIIPAKLQDYSQDYECFGNLPNLHLPYTLRSDYAQAVQQLCQNLSHHGTTSKNQSFPVDTIRTMDVAHFWPIRLKENKAAHLRNEVTKVLLTFRNVTNANVIADFVSEANSKGRTGYANAYAKALLDTKIVVVAQRDKYEDHYRLFEAYVGGAMVMTDPMTSLPDGLVDGESIVIYQSLDHLEQLIVYYLEQEAKRLAIAHKGWKIAMTRHRTYHWMEKIFFGRQLTSDDVQ